MSHFVGLVIITPQYRGNLEDSLEKYNENIEVEPYVDSKVSNIDKYRVVSCYSMDKKERNDFIIKAYDYIKDIKSKEGVQMYSFEEYCKDFANSCHFIEMNDEQRRMEWLNYSLFKEDNYRKEFSDYLETQTDILSKFVDVYNENGDDWNGNVYKQNKDGVWEEWSTYNPDSKWDWYVYDTYSRYDGYLLTKDGEYTNECRLSEIDLSKPNDKDTNYHLSDDTLPFCVVVDGVWHERAEMGWWAITSNEKPKEEWEKEVKGLFSSLSADSEVTAVDFHI